MFLFVLYSKEKRQKPGQSGHRSMDRVQQEVGIPTRYGLDGPGIASRFGRDFLHMSRPALGPLQLLCNGYRVSFPWIKRPGHGVKHPPPLSAEVKERVELYLFSPSGPAWPVLGRTLLYLLPYKCQGQTTVF